MIGAGLGSLAVLAAFIGWEARSRHPMLKLGFFRDRRFSVAAAGREALGSSGCSGRCSCKRSFCNSTSGYSPLQAGLRILPTAALLLVSAALSPIVARVIGVKFTAAAGLAAIAGGLWQISAASTVATTYGQVVIGLLLIGLGAGLLMPTATNSVVGSVPQGDAGVGSATNVVAIQVGGALGVVVIGSVLSTRYQDHMTTALAARHLPTAVTHAILGSFGGALQVAGQARRCHRCTAGTCRTHGFHERRAGVTGRRRLRRRRWRRARARVSTIATLARSRPGRLASLRRSGC